MQGNAVPFFPGSGLAYISIHSSTSTCHLVVSISTCTLQLALILQLSKGWVHGAKYVLEQLRVFLQVLRTTLHTHVIVSVSKVRQGNTGH